MSDREISPLATVLAGLRLRSPLILSSGILGVTASSLARVARLGAGAVTTKSFGPAERKGHPCPVIVPFEHGVINAVGLSNPGCEEALPEIAEYRSMSRVPIIVSIFGGTPQEFALVAETVAASRPDLIEVNVSCPNVAAEFGRPFGTDPASTETVTRLVKERAGDIPVAVKLTPNCLSIAEQARAAEAGGADAITAINSIGPGMLIDVEVRRPILANRVGGVSGACILPIAVRCVWDIYKAVKIPIIGGGGVVTAEHALQLILAGATAVGIGSGIYHAGIEIFENLNRDLHAFLAERGIASLGDLIGGAHGPN